MFSALTQEFCFWEPKKMFKTMRMLLTHERIIYGAVGMHEKKIKLNNSEDGQIGYYPRNGLLMNYYAGIYINLHKDDIAS